MQVFWFGVVVEQLSEAFVEGMVLAEGMPESESVEVNPELLHYMVLARAGAACVDDAKHVVAAQTKDLKPIAFHLICDQVEQAVRSERRIANSLSEDEVSLHSRFIGFVRESEAAQFRAIEILKIAVIRKSWQFWR